MTANFFAEGGTQQQVLHCLAWCVEWRANHTGEL